MSKEEIVLFDLDGTLIDSTPAILKGFYHSFEVMGFDFNGGDKEIIEQIGYPLDIMYKNLGISDERIEEAVDIYKEKYRKISNDLTVLLDDASASVELASSFARLGIVTTKTTKFSIELLEYLGIMNKFETIVGRQEVVNPKPHPEPIFKVLKQMDVKKEDYDIWMIGDTKLDLIASNEAGINCVGVLCGYGEYEDLKHYTPHIVQNPLQAVELIKSFK